MRCVHGAGFVSVTNDGRECSGRYRQTTWMCWTSKRRGIRIHPSLKVEDAPTVLKLPKTECPDFCTRLPRHK